jgi:galactokinase
MNIIDWKNEIASHHWDSALTQLYGKADPSRFLALLEDFEEKFGEGDVRFFSAPGRVELCGNHTDHQHGCVVALAVDLDILGVVRKREDNIVNLLSMGAEPCHVDLDGQAPEQGTSDALIYGVAKGLQEKGYLVGGFDCCTCSAVPFGSGLSSSAAFENYVATVFSEVYNDGKISPLDKALVGQWAENIYFGKPCGLMDQLASCLGNVSFIDFKDPKNPIIRQVSMPPEKTNHVLCVVKTGGSHADLTHHYAAIPEEMKRVAEFFGKEVLSDLTKEDVLNNIPALRETVGDRAVLRALNYYDETSRSHGVLKALEQEDFTTAFSLLEASGVGSQCWLKNVSNPEDTEFDGVGMALYVSKMLCPNGTFRVHGGGFGGTMLGLIPTERFLEYKQNIEKVFGEDSCIPLLVRPFGGIEIDHRLQRA